MSFNYMEEIGTPANLEGVNHLANLNYASCVRFDLQSWAKDYNVNCIPCFRMESGYCGIRWSQYPSDVWYWTILVIFLVFIHFNNSMYSDGELHNVWGREQNHLNNAAGREGSLLFLRPEDRLPIRLHQDTWGKWGRKHSHLKGQVSIRLYLRYLLKDFDCLFKTRFCGTALGFCRVKTGQTVQCDPALGAVVTYQKPFVLGVVTDMDEGGALTANNAPEDKANRGFKLIYNQQPCMAGWSGSVIKGTCLHNNIYSLCEILKYDVIIPTMWGFWIEIKTTLWCVFV